MTIEPGNLNDQTHFKKTHQQSRNRLREGSLVIFDKGANNVTNTRMILADNLQYITGKKINKSDDKKSLSLKSIIIRLLMKNQGFVELN